MRILPRFQQSVAVLTVFLGLFLGCGGDDSDDSDEESKIIDGCDAAKLELNPGEASMVALCDKTKTATIEFPSSAADQQYIISPFTVGADTVDAAGSQQFPLKITKTKFKATEAASLSAIKGYSLKDIELQKGLYQLRIANIFIASKGLGNQAPGFWSLVDHYDLLTQMKSQMQKASKSLPLTKRPTMRSRILAKIERSKKSGNALNLTAGVCPKQGDTIPGTDGTAASVVETDSYCIVYEGDPLYATDKNKISSAMDRIFSDYNGTIFKGQNLKAAAGFTFKPVVVFVDTDSLTAIEYTTGSGIIGFFHADTTSEQKMPYLFMLNDLDDVFETDGVQENQVAQRQKNSFATIAHEIFHAYHDYFKVKVHGGDPEILPIDEGMAHFVEALFGHQDKALDLANEFLTLFPTRLNPFLIVPENYSLSTGARGGAYSFIHYLVDQKGGVSYTDGKVSGGGGLDFFAKAVTSKETGKSNLAGQFDYSWTEVVGNFNAALVLDNTSIFPGNEKYAKKARISTVTNLLGTTDQPFGFRFNHNGKAVGSVSDQFNGASESESIKHFHLAPNLLTAEGEGASVVVELGAKNSAVTVVRIK